jgi:ADP-ribose pyrophosphatase YjhB (NUDIX family)
LPEQSSKGKLAAMAEESSSLRGPINRRIPDGDDKPRLVCDDCGFIAYENPKVIVGAVCTWEGKFLLCRRAIEPRSGYWTMPAGYLELNETTDEGAVREVWEEAKAQVRLDGLLAIYNIPRISQVHMIYRGVMTGQECAPGLESLDVGLFAWEEIPWQDLAYPNVSWSLNHYKQSAGKALAAPYGVPDGLRL